MTTAIPNKQNQQAERASRKQFRRPRYDVMENQDAFVVRIHLPGVKKKDLQLSLEEGELYLNAPTANAIPEGWKPLRKETSSAEYRLALSLNVDVDETKIDAQMENGVLHLSLPKAEEVKPRKIEVK